MRIVFIGSPPFAQRSFEQLLSGSTPPIGLITAPPRRAGRGRKPIPNPLAESARERGLPVLEPVSARDPEFLQQFAEWQPDLGVVVSYGQILSEAFLAIPGWGCINLHGSVLPRWRGASPVQAALLAGDSQSGVTVQKVVRALDAGAVLAHRELSIGPRETAPELTARIAELGAGLLGEFLAENLEGLPAGVEQDESLVTVCRKIRKEQGYVDWSHSAIEIDRLVRAMAGWPMAQTRLSESEVLRLHEAVVEDGQASEPPGTILELAPSWKVATGDGVLSLRRIQRPGKGILSAEAFLRGAKLAPGDRFLPMEVEQGSREDG